MSTAIYKGNRMIRCTVQPLGQILLILNMPHPHNLTCVLSNIQVQQHKSMAQTFRMANTSPPKAPSTTKTKDTQPKKHPTQLGDQVDIRENDRPKDPR